MKVVALALVLTAILAPAALGQTFPSYFSTTDLTPVSPGALKFGLYGYDNPATLTYMRQSDMAFIWNDAGGRWNDFNRWGFFSAGPNGGFGVVKTKVGSASITDYKLSASFGDRTAGFGMGYGFTGGDKGAFDRRNYFTLGSLIRPERHFSLGLVGNVTTSGGRTEGAFDLGVRPLGDELVTLFSDYSIQNNEKLKTGGWSYGAAVEALPGIRFTARIFDTHAFTFGISLSLGHAGFAGQSSYASGGTHAFNTYAIRLGAFDRTILEKLMHRSRYVELNMNGGMTYQRFVLFDNRNTLKGFLDAIDAAEKDETVGGIAINTSGMEVNREMLWEIREQLRHFRAAGKKVVIFIDKPSLEEYRFASVADRIVLDPTGMIMLPGYVWSNTFVKGTLEKLGIGFDELRFFKYKSAEEMLSRDRMSDADREQKQRYIDDQYASARADICEGRRITPEQFDSLVNNAVLLLPRDALAKGLVDTLGRWEEVRAMFRQMPDGGKWGMGARGLEVFKLPYDNRWGEPPHIAVIYALGACAMDEGINARSLVHVVDAAGADPSIKAIVLRVDSPGGDGTASDYIAEAVKRAKKNKPVIVSQGFVAASGGYWLSMDADTIVASPATITGSIGVIAGWVYNKDLKEKLGMSTDRVQAGAHADLGTGFSVPFLGVGLPDRDLTEAERAKAEQAIRTFYADFVGKVAEGRKTTPDKIEPIAQGHFYSGVEGKAIGLVDVLGGLEDAIAIARRKAGISPDEEVKIIQLPRPGLLDFSKLFPKIVGVKETVLSDPLIEQMKFRLRYNGQPMPLMPLEEMTAEIPAM